MLAHESRISQMNQRKAYFDDSKIISVLEEYKLSQSELDTIRELININKGAISPTLIRAHLKRGYGGCARIADKLITLGLVKALKPDVKGIVLSKEKRKGFWG